MSARLALAGALLVALVPARADESAAARDITVVPSLRDTGYMLGDLIEEQVAIDLPPSLSIERESLPLPGRVAPWLEVRAARLSPRDASGVVGLVVTYQIFAETESAARVPLPGFRLRARDGANIRTIDVPEQSFLLSPGLPAMLTDEDRELRPSLEPEPLPVAGDVLAALACLALATIAAGYLLWRYDKLPFLPRAPGPLARTWRRWRRRRDLSPEQETLLLRAVHAALSESAGGTLYPSTLELLFERAPFLAPLRERIERLFAWSWNRFYGPGDGEPLPHASVLVLLREAADRERGVPC